MEIVLADSLGFCMGVKRAVDLAFKALDKSPSGPVATLGPLIHNSQEIARLERAGITEVDINSIPNEGTVIIRAHGVTPNVYDELKSRGLKIMDGTCPYVHYSQRKAVELARDGYTVVIVGDEKHPEIKGILGFIDNKAYCVKSVEDVESLPAIDRIGIIAQTTISPAKYEAVVNALKEKSTDVKVCETICDATEENQKAIRELSDKVDMIYVVGGRHSANSVKLVETAKLKCQRSFLIETEAEINVDDLSGVKKIGISAGASTPDWMIRKVIEKITTLVES